MFTKFHLLSAGHQCGGAGAVGQHDDWNGWHRKQMWVKTRQNDLYHTISLYQPAGTLSCSAAYTYFKNCLHQRLVCHRVLCRAISCINTDGNKTEQIDCSGSENTNSHVWLINSLWIYLIFLTGQAIISGSTTNSHENGW